MLHGNFSNETKTNAVTIQEGVSTGIRKNINLKNVVDGNVRFRMLCAMQNDKRKKAHK